MKAYLTIFYLALSLLATVVFFQGVGLAAEEGVAPVKESVIKVHATQWRVLPGKANQAFPSKTWWEAFEDQPLNGLIQEALSGNFELKKVKEKITAAQAVAKSYRSPLLPTLGLGGQYNWQQYGKQQFVFPLQGRTYHSFQTPLSVSYQTDFFGKNLTVYRAAQKGVDVARYEYEAAQNVLAGEVATTYINLSKLRYLEKLAQTQLDASEKLLSHAQALLELGQATIFDLQAIQLRFDQTEADLSILSGNRQVAENQLDALLGTSPTFSTPKTVTDWERLSIPQSVLTGIPSEMVTHRPDVAVAEAQLDAAKLDVQAARRAVLPSLNLTGSSGFNAIGIGNLFKIGSLSNVLISSLSQPISQGGRLRAEIRLRKSNYQQLLDNYQQTLINAFTDVENNLALLQVHQKSYEDVQGQVEHVTDIALKEKQKMEWGISSEPLWLAQESQRIDYEKTLAQQKAQVMIDYVGLAKALGGGFVQPVSALKTN